VTENDLKSAAAQLVRRLRRQRPLRAGSLIVTIFGDSIMPRGGAIALGSLIRVAAPFGLNQRLVRTATARLVHDGWLTARRVGNLSEYRLSAEGRERFAEATTRIYAGPVTGWSGHWSLIVLAPLPAAQRQKVRQELLWRGFGEIRSGVFAHPENLPARLEAPSAAPGWWGEALLFEARLTGTEAARRLVALGWDLAELGRRYAAFSARFAAAHAAAAASARPTPETAFIIRTLLIHEYRRLHLRDPLLPVSLLGAQWPGTRAAELCRDLYARLFTPSETHLTQVAALLDGPLPPPDAAVLDRFGGIGRASIRGPAFEQFDDP
jgi:phenylacetic acid degradation operon negative regulatory protein